MTEQTAIIITQDYGASLSTPTLRNYLTDTLIIAADSANEVTADSGRYALVFDETSVHAAGWYALRAFVSGAPINRFVYFTGVDGETAIAVDNLPVGLPQTGQVIVTRPVGDDTPITFSFPVASATLTGTRRINNAGSTTALSGARSFLRTSGTQHLYSLAYNAADRPSDDGVVEYVFTDGTYSRSVVLKAVTAVLDSGAILAVADQVWDEAMSGHTTAGTYGGRIVRATNSNTEVQITGSNHIAADVHDVRPNGLSGSTQITNIENASGYLLAVLAGACADPQTASETYAITVFGSTFTVDMAGQTSTGARTAPSLTKT